MKNRFFLAASLLSLTLSEGCGIVTPLHRSKSKLDWVAIGQSKSDVMNRVGNPNKVLDIPQNLDGSCRETVIYRLYGKTAWIYNAVFCPLSLSVSCWFPIMTATSTYKMEFKDGTLIRIFKVPDDSRRSLLFPKWPVP